MVQLGKICCEAIERVDRDVMVCLYMVSKLCSIKNVKNFLNLLINSLKK